MMSELIREINDDNFAQVVLQSDRPVLVDFWAPWCGPCRALAPTLEKVAATRVDRALVVKLNVETSPNSAERFAVRAIPTLVLFKGGREVVRLLGAVNRAEIACTIDHHIDAGANGEDDHGTRTV
jgi:thioredoxin